MTKSVFVFGALFVCVLASMSISGATYAAPKTAGVKSIAASAYFFCRAGLNNRQHTVVGEVMPENPVKVLEFGAGITSRLSLTNSQNLSIEVLHGDKVVSSMAVKKGTTQFAMTAGGIEMSCYNEFNRDGF